ncbi:aspartic proteinase 36-like [Rhodamnia argentea]|uniref:Aspartic proteinase 36-like n=1 Tax=Rhodamnia argentea TaxID=178133 RepID=A0A8B8Q310_9MYRT|nr:aspartic proteinase 36-like [Rhodamnia argentea]
MGPTGSLAPAAAVLCLAVLCLASVAAADNVVLEVQHRFKGRRGSLLGAMRSHDALRHGRLLSAVDLPLGGNGIPSDTGLYFAKIGIGTPSKDYYVQVDTGSDTLWVNCIGCDKCPTKSDLGVDLTLYDPKGSSSADLITCDQDFCTSTYHTLLPGCKPDLLCEYKITYGDGSSTTGYFVEDNVHLDQVTGNLRSSPMNSSVIFGCAAKQSGGLGTSSEALDGIIGFGQANSSMLSQLASSGKVKKVFAHCLDSVHGGGIFTIGEVVEPKVNTTPLVPNQAHYNVVMKAVEVGGDVLELTRKSIFDSGDERGTIIDSGTTLAYLPGDVYNPLMEKIMAQQPGLEVHTVEEQFSCFQFVGSVDDGFPVVKFHFDGSLALAVYPHDYLFQYHDNVWCVGFMSGDMQTKDGKDITLFGDLVLSNKLVVYDLENQTIGWVDYNCSSHITVKDEKSGATYAVGAHDLGSCSKLVSVRLSAALLLLVSVLYTFML